MCASRRAAKNSPSTVLPKPHAMRNVSSRNSPPLPTTGWCSSRTTLPTRSTALRQSPETPIKELLSNAATIVTKKRFVAPKTPTQKTYIEAIETHDIVIGIGPAGTGKTYLAMAMAVSALMKREVNRIILARPAVEAGEKLGFLPGDMYAKVNPYLRPLYDALFDMMDMERATRAIERGDIEIAPLGFMRGRTLNDSFVILDEAQNATAEQMKMFLTRLGFHSKVVVTGDITQVDLPPERVSGLIEVRDILCHVEGIRFVYFDERDVVRHKLVQDIIKAYDQHQNPAQSTGQVAQAGHSASSASHRRSPQSPSTPPRVRGANRINKPVLLQCHIHYDV